MVEIKVKYTRIYNLDKLNAHTNTDYKYFLKYRHVSRSAREFGHSVRISRKIEMYM